MGMIRKLSRSARATLIAALLVVAYSGYVIAQIITGTAGIPVPQVVSMQGVPNGTPVPVIISGGVAGSGATPYHLAGASTASTNATLASSAARTLKSLSLENVQSSTIGYFRLYDSSTTPTCSSSTGAIQSIPVIPGPGGITVPLPPEGWKLSSGFAFCITGGGSDTDNTNAPTGIYVIASYE